MSIDIYPTRLYWLNGRGGARLNGSLPAILTSAPHLPGLLIDGIDYAPGAEVAMVMPRRDGWRDLTAAEIVAVHALLEQLTQKTGAYTVTKL